MFFTSSDHTVPESMLSWRSKWLEQLLNSRLSGTRGSVASAERMRTLIPAAASRAYTEAFALPERPSEVW